MHKPPYGNIILQWLKNEVTTLPESPGICVQHLVPICPVFSKSSHSEDTYKCRFLFVYHTFKNYKIKDVRTVHDTYTITVESAKQISAAHKCFKSDTLRLRTTTSVSTKMYIISNYHMCLPIVLFYTFIKYMIMIIDYNV